MGSDLENQKLYNHKEKHPRKYKFSADPREGAEVAIGGLRHTGGAIAARRKDSEPRLVSDQNALLLGRRIDDQKRAKNPDRARLDSATG